MSQKFDKGELYHGPKKPSLTPFEPSPVYDGPLKVPYSSPEIGSASYYPGSYPGIQEPGSKIDYKYSEEKILDELAVYIDKTYGEHYSHNKLQTTEFVIDAGHGVGFCVGNIMKYAQRYRRKGDRAEWRKDILKVIHYAIMLLHVHDNNLD